MKVFEVILQSIDLVLLVKLLCCCSDDFDDVWCWFDHDVLDTDELAVVERFQGFKTWTGLYKISDDSRHHKWNACLQTAGHKNFILLANQYVAGNSQNIKKSDVNIEIVGELADVTA